MIPTFEVIDLIWHGLETRLELWTFKFQYTSMTCVIMTREKRGLQCIGQICFPGKKQKNLCWCKFTVGNKVIYRTSFFLNRMICMALEIFWPPPPSPLCMLYHQYYHGYCYWVIIQPIRHPTLREHWTASKLVGCSLTGDTKGQTTLKLFKQWETSCIVMVVIMVARAEGQLGFRVRNASKTNSNPISISNHLVRKRF